MLVLFSLASIHLRGHRHAEMLSCCAWPQQRGAAQAMLLVVHSCNLPAESQSEAPESASGGSGLECKTKFKPWGPARGLHAMMTAVAGMVDRVRVTEITAAVSRTRASVLQIIITAAVSRTRASVLQIIIPSEPRTEASEDSKRGQCF